MNDVRDNLDAYRSRRISTRRGLAIGVLLLLLLPVLVLVFLISRFDPNRYAPAIIAAVEQASGRQLTLGGPITIRFSLAPVIEASHISLSNPPGFADPQLATLSRVEAKIALLPLLSHRVDIIQLVLVDPDITLEPGKTGAADWNFFPASPLQTQGASAPPGAGQTNAPPGAGQTNAPQGAGQTNAPQGAETTGGGYKIALQSVEIRDGKLTLKGAKGDTSVVIAINRLDGVADSPAAPLHLTAAALLGTTPFKVSGVVGPIERFSGIGIGPWPVDLTVELAGARLRVLGAVDQPRDAHGYDLAADLNIPDLAQLASGLPPGLTAGLNTPPLHNIEASARIVDQNAIMPAIDGLTIKAGPARLSSLRPGLALNGLDIEMASLDQPLTLNATGELGDTALILSGNFGAPQGLLNPAWLPGSMPAQGSFPVSVTAQIGPAKITVNGAIATPATLAGAALAVNAAIPDLSALGPLAGWPLPAWKNIAAQATLIDPGGLGLRAAAGFDGLTVTLDNAAFGGDASLYFGPQPRLQVALQIAQANLDALRAAMPRQAPAAAAQPAAGSAKTIPDIQLPLKILKTATADVQISADTLTWNNASYTALQAHAVLANGVLTVNPLTGELPGGSVTANAMVDATREPAAETLSFNAPALALAPFLRTFGLPNTAEGTMQARLAATSTGDGLRAMAAAVNGQLGLAMVNGVVDGAVMEDLFGAVLRTVGLPDGLLGAQGPVAVRCMGLAINASTGIGDIRTLTLDSTRLLLQGGGTVDLADETLAIVLRPQLQIAGTQVGVPVQVGGSFAAPTTEVAPAGAVQAAAKTALGLPVDAAQTVLGSQTILARVASSLGLGNTGDVCPAALSLGRLGNPGPAAPPPRANVTLPGAAQVLSGPKNLLNSILGP